jgi:HK97 family phage portal protein
MKIKWPWAGAGQLAGESRSNLENPNVPISSAAVATHFSTSRTKFGLDVTVESALGIPAFWQGTDFLAKTLASLPIQIFKSTPEGAVPSDIGGIREILHSSPNTETTAYDWRKLLHECVYLYGRGLAWLEWGANNRLMNIWHLDPTMMRVRKSGGKKLYDYTDGRRTITYEAWEILDIPWRLQRDGITHRNPIYVLREALGAAIAANNYAGQWFEDGGVAQHVMSGAPMSPEAWARAVADLKRVLKTEKQVLPMPAGYELKPLGGSPKDGQMIEARQFEVVEVARILGLPPSFLMDLQYGNLANVEQQGLQLVKHAIAPQVAQFEAEINLKIFGGRGRKAYAKFNLDALMRGDLLSRMQAYSMGIQNAVLKPDEARALEDRGTVEGGDQAFVQGATVPLNLAGIFQTKGPTDAAT